MKKIKLGRSVSKGYGFGQPLYYEPYEPEIKRINHLTVEASIPLYENALHNAETELKEIQDSLKSDPDKALIFGAHLEILNDIALDMMIREKMEQGEHPSLAIHESYQAFKEMLLMVDDPLIKERVADLIDVEKRILRNLEHKKAVNLSSLNEDVIVFAHDLLPSDTATMDKSHVKGIITEVGSNTSHAAIIARSYHIPALIGANLEFIQSILGKPIILDTILCEMITDYDASTRMEYQKIARAFYDNEHLLNQYLAQKAITKDGTSIEIHLNIESDQDDALNLAPYVEGVGLFRSEFLFMKNTQFPTLTEQKDAYESVSNKLYPKPVTLRTLDIGGDKTLSYFQLPKEENPFLGKRALRLCLDNIDMFKTQIKAALLASKQNIQLMFPMVGSLEDIERAYQVVDACKSELKIEGLSYDEKLKLGIMIEIPSIALMSDEIAQIVDFASIGTNDLTQYLHAVDRMNSDLQDYYQNYSVALFRLLKQIQTSFSHANKPLSICGELGGDPIGAPILVGLGYRKLSMSKSQVARVKSILCENTLSDLEMLAEKVLASKTQDEVLEWVKKIVK